ncbi:MAG: hypothetical protein WCC12_21580, partial [Anaerolineales bacterium]
MSNRVAAFKKVLSNRRFVGALLFVVFLYAFEEWLFDFPQLKFFQLVTVFFARREALIALASSAMSLLICYFFAWAALGSSRLFQGLYIFLFGLSS